MGRFTQPDPIVADPFNPQSLNRYSFVLGDPAQLVDPTGLDPESGPSQADLQNRMNATLGDLPLEPPQPGSAGAAGARECVQSLESSAVSWLPSGQPAAGSE